MLFISSESNIREEIDDQSIGQESWAYEINKLSQALLAADTSEAESALCKSRNKPDLQGALPPDS